MQGFDLHLQTFFLALFQAGFRPYGPKLQNLMIANPVTHGKQQPKIELKITQKQLKIKAIIQWLNNYKIKHNAVQGCILTFGSVI